MRNNYAYIEVTLQEHFNINNEEIIQPKPEDYPDEWNVMGRYCEIVTKDIAYENSISFGVGKEELQEDEKIGKYIGYYKRLGETNYYFRWL